MPDALVEARARELWDRCCTRSSHQGIYRETYLRIAGRDEDEIVEQGKPDAEQALRREAVLAAIVEAEGIEPTEDEILEARRARRRRRRERDVAEEAARAAALATAGSTRSRTTSPSARRSTCVAESAKPIAVEQAQARDKLWTPGNDWPERPGRSGPGS